jgi:ankyrin repeat protein
MSADDELFAAIERGDVDRVRAALAAGADPNAIQPDHWPGWRPLHASIEALEDGGPLETLSVLLKHGATVDGWDAQHDATPLLMAVFRGQKEAVRFLLDARADVNVVGGEGDSPLRWAVQSGDTELVRLLLERGATRDLDVGGGPSGMNALGIAAHRLDVLMVRLLLEAGARPDATDANGWMASRRANRPDNAERLEQWRQVMALLEQRQRSE